MGKSSNKSLVNKFFEYALGSGVVLLLGFISSPINTRLFTPEAFGQFSMFGLYTNILSFIILIGLDQSFIRYFYHEEENQRGLLYQTIKYPILACLIISFLTIIFWGWVSKTLFSSSNIEPVIVFLVTNFVLVFNRFSFLVIRMLQKGRLYSYLQIVQKATNIFITLILVKVINDGFLTLILSMTISLFIATFISIILSKDMWKLRGTNKKIKTKNSELIKFGLPLVFTFLVTWLFQAADRIFIKYYNDYYELGLYSAAFSIVALLNAVQTAFSTFWIPVAYEHYEKDPEDKTFFRKINSIVTFAMFGIGIFLILFKDIIIFLLGKEFRGASNIMPFLVLMPIMYTISETTVLGINFKKKSKYHFIIAIISAVANIIGNILLVPKYGAVGAAISTGLSYNLFFTLRTLVSQKLFKVEYQLKKFYFMCFCMTLFALYATFYSFDYYYLVIGLTNLILLVLLYKEIIIEIKHYFLNKKQVYSKERAN
ncbi:lipopolysaccharide biosynthesis protein [Fictibacillus sp. S7]|uniref:lipopolysaccharide biosynthesis protein n=1 Tax=Fictibacillus sp. S7 TaxID=2212476 RepID=UPI0010105407|nr:oligosaccharide flippase family protein [Fictibacillus sp. S7]RXZ01495.1 polysaccharide biosynthesis protein [Fictibacillus sp. S7]